jgi:hypothetical protein
MILFVNELVKFLVAELGDHPVEEADKVLRSHTKAQRQRRSGTKITDGISISELLSLWSP